MRRRDHDRHLRPDMRAQLWQQLVPTLVGQDEVEENEVVVRAVGTHGGDGLGGSANKVHVERQHADVLLVRLLEEKVEQLALAFIILDDEHFDGADALWLADVHRQADAAVDCGGRPGGTEPTSGSKFWRAACAATA